MPMRWRWPPENWCQRLMWSALRPTRSISSRTLAVRPFFRHHLGVDVEGLADDVTHRHAGVE